MNKLESVVEKFNKNLESIDQIANIGSDTSDIAIEYLESLKKSNEDSEGFLPYKNKLDIAVGEIRKIKQNPIIIEKYQVIYTQVIVLLVSNFESFLNDLFITLLDNFVEIFIWQKDNKKIIFEVGILEYKVPTLGEVILKSLKTDFSFQDLQSTFKLFNEHLGIDLNKVLDKDIIDNLIVNQAKRHSIIHNNGKADEKYLKQIRDTIFSKKFEINQTIKISENEYFEAKKTFVDTVIKIKDSVLERLILTYGEDYIN